MEGINIWSMAAHMNTGDVGCYREVLALIYERRANENNPLIGSAIEHEILKRMGLQAHRQQVARSFRAGPPAEAARERHSPK